MTNLCTKVTVRKRPIKNGQTSLYLDFYPPIRNPKTGRLSRREYLGLYIYSNPTEKFQQEYNRSIMQKAELIKCRRTESIINEEFGFLDRSKGQESFLDYFKQCMNKTTNKANWEAAYKHFVKYSGGECRFCDLDVAYCQKFVDYLLSAECYHNGKPMMPTTANNHLVKLKAALRMAYDDGHIKENIAKKLVKAKGHGNKRQYLTKEELVALSKAECKSDVLRRSGLFSCLTGLRLSDCILLQWENIKKSGDGGWVLDITTKKTKTAHQRRGTCPVRRAWRGSGVQETDTEPGCRPPQRLDKGCWHHQAHHFSLLSSYIRHLTTGRRHGHLHREQAAYPQQPCHNTGVCRGGQRTET